MKLLPLTLMLVALSAHAQGWVSVAESTAGEMFLDLTSVKEQGRYRKAWVRFSYAVPKATAFGAQSSFKSLQYFDCKAGASAVKQELAFPDQGGNGEPLARVSHTDEEMTFEDPGPGSLGQMVLNRVCRGKGQ